MKALVVDDSMTFRRIVIKSLAEIGITDYVEAGDGEEALAATKAAPFDVILLDWNMPRLTGIDTVRALRGEGNKTPIIMVTTEAEKTRVIEAIRAGVNDYLIKPFTPQQLGEKIRAILPVAAT